MSHAMNRRLTGVLGPVITPFEANEDVDLEAFAFNLRSHFENGLDGVVVCGSTGEAALLSEEERASLVTVAREIVPRDKWLIVGTGAESTRSTVQRCRSVAARGADAVLVVAPHYYGASAMTPLALRAHYTRVADESPIPVLLYNIPKYMHFRLEPELIAALADHPNIAGMKDSSGDMSYLERCIVSQNDSFTVLTGNGATWATALSLGASGGILAVALFAAELSVEIWHAHIERHPDDAEDLQKRLTPLAVEIVGRMGVAGVKSAMDRVGLRGGPVRGPLLPLSPADDARVVELLRASSLAERP
jgi:4-hydroxy-tetrahydrodipicolinate synthase